MPTKTTRPATRRTGPAPRRVPAPQLHITPTDKHVTIKDLQCQVWEGTDDKGKTYLVYVPLIRVADVAADGEVTYELEPVRTIDSGMVLPLEIPTYLQGTSYRSLEITHLLRILNTPSEREYATVREMVEHFLAHGKITDPSIFPPSGYECAVYHVCLPRVHASVIDEGSPQLEDEGQWIAVPVHTGEALYRWTYSKDPWRLKRCIECGQYFFDATKNGRKKHCTARCSTRRGTRTWRARLSQ